MASMAGRTLPTPGRETPVDHESFDPSASLTSILLSAGEATGHRSVSMAHCSTSAHSHTSVLRPVPIAATGFGNCGSCATHQWTFWEWRMPMRWAMSLAPTRSSTSTFRPIGAHATGGRRFRLLYKCMCKNRPSQTNRSRSTTRSLREHSRRRIRDLGRRLAEASVATEQVVEGPILDGREGWAALLSSSTRSVSDASAGMIGRTYLERGQPVEVLVRWAPGAGVIRNVLIRRHDGSLVVRPFRGLRRPTTSI